MKFQTSYSFDDVLLIPKKSEISSRKEIDLSVSLGNCVDLRIPIISSPMDTVTASPMAAAMSYEGGIGIIHRYNTIETQCEHISSLPSEALVGAAVGVSGDFIDRATALYDSGVTVLCLDIAHGHHILMKKALTKMRDIFGSHVHIMAGNVATLSAFNDLSDWGADSIRVGIGGGSICSTRIQTGHGMPTLQSVFDCAQSDRDATLVADGGLRNSGDIVKALAAGADCVMLGSMLAGTEESPGDLVIVRGESRKIYRGMASKDAQINWRGHFASVEGVSSTIPYKGLVRDVIHDIERGMRSGLSYSGARTISELQSKASFILQTSAGSMESSTHINNL